MWNASVQIQFRKKNIMKGIALILVCNSCSCVRTPDPSLTHQAYYHHHLGFNPEHFHLSRLITTATSLFHVRIRLVLHPLKCSYVFPKFYQLNSLHFNVNKRNITGVDNWCKKFQAIFCGLWTWNTLLLPEACNYSQPVWLWVGIKNKMRGKCKK